MGASDKGWIAYFYLVSNYFYFPNLTELALIWAPPLKLAEHKPILGAGWTGRRRIQRARREAGVEHPRSAPWPVSRVGALGQRVFHSGGCLVSHPWKHVA